MNLKFQQKLRNSIFSNPEFIKQYINSNEVDLSYDNNFLLFEIFDSFRILSFEYFQSDKKMTSFKYLLNDKRVLTGLQPFLEDTNEELIEFVLNYLKSKNNLDYINFQTFRKHNISLCEKFIAAVKRGDYKAFKDFLKNPNIKINYRSNQALYEACKNGRLKIFKELIKHPDANPSDGSQRCLYTAISGNKYKIVSILLNDKRINPTLHENYAMTASIYAECNKMSWNTTATFNLLKKDKRIDISAFDNSVLFRTLLDMNSHYNNPRQYMYDNMIKDILLNENVKEKLNQSFIDRLLNDTYNIEEHFIFKKIINIIKENRFKNF